MFGLFAHSVILPTDRPPFSDTLFPSGGNLAKLLELRGLPSAY